MKGWVQYAIAAIAGLVVASSLVLWLNANAVFDEYISKAETEREIIIAIHVGEEARLFTESMMEYTLNAAIPLTLESGGHPGSEEYEGSPSLNKVRYWGWCEDRKNSATIDCSNDDCDYMDIDDVAEDQGLKTGEFTEQMLSDGLPQVLEDSLEKYAQAFMGRKSYETSLSPEGVDISVSLDSGTFGYATKVESRVFTTQKDAEYGSRGFIESKDDYSASISSPAVEDILDEGIGVLKNLPIVDIAEQTDQNSSISGTDEWILVFERDIEDAYNPADYSLKATVPVFEEDPNCKDITVKLTLTSAQPEYWVYREDRLVQEPLNLTFIVQRRINP